MNYLTFSCSIILALCSACTTPYLRSAQTSFNGSGFGVALAVGSAYSEAQPARSLGEGSMGNWNSRKRAGQARQHGFVAPVGDADWAVAPTAPTTASAGRSSSFPTGVDRWEVLAVNVATGVVAFNNASTSTPITLTGLVSGQTYRVYAAWSFNLRRVSDWSAPKLITQP